MRPVLLEMDGFASYRQKTTMDFDGVDYFALIGPTGAGKSTIIDAVTFALYGCVVRWDDARAVEPALAPTVNRGSLKLVFDAGGDRYVAVRILQRSGSGGVAQKVARLERLADPKAVGGPDDATEVLADTIDGTRKAVEQLLGLDFGQFTKCVALPQGQFAELLHAKPADRDRILTKLLGLDVYLQIGQIARERASRLTTKADALQHHLDEENVDTSDATLATAVRQADALEALRTQIDDDGMRLSGLIEEATVARRHVQERAAEIERLDSLEVPGGIDDLDDRITETTAAYRQADATASAAEQADSQARAGVNGHPRRAVLERLRDHHRELADLTGRQPQMAERVAATTRSAQASSAELIRARARLETARVSEATADEALRNAVAARTEHIRRRDLLAAVEAPAGLDKITTRIAEARSAAAGATADLETARQSLRQGEAVLGCCPSVVVLERAAASVAEARGALAALRDHVTALAPLHRHARERRTVAAGDAGTLKLMRAEAEAFQERAVAADLRGHLEVDHQCPVCDQRVTALPPPLDASGAQAALMDLAEAESRTESSKEAAIRSNTQLEAARATVMGGADALAERLSGAAAALADLPDLVLPPLVLGLEEIAGLTVGTDPETLRAVSTRLLAQLEAHDGALDEAASQLQGISTDRRQADAAVASAADAVTEAEERVRAATSAVDATSVERERAESALRKTRDPLVALGAPALDGADLAGAWHRLVAWSAQAAATEAVAEAAAAGLVDTRRADHQQARGALDQAQQAAAGAESAHAETASEQQRAVAALEQCELKLSELHQALAGARSAEAVAGLLSELDHLEKAADDAAHRVDGARRSRSSAAAALDAVQDEERAARAALNTSRDGLAAIGSPPSVDGTGIARSWADLVAWATATKSGVTARRDEAAAEAERLARQGDQLAEAMRERLMAAGVDATDSRSPHLWAAAAVAAAGASAAETVKHIHESRRRREATAAAVDRARADAAVAEELGRLLAINGFPRWLNRNALEVLATSASDTLMELSGGQFELTLSDGESANFTVIDHADADAVRMVKTLSGGETFQASLALALALARNLGALANNGAAQLDALFIDEGFGTLDETTLEVVASTLESLALDAGRMVGLVTHVPSLAARVPVRFRVDRDPRGSTVVREGA
jgi:exonuclease SbcC